MSISELIDTLVDGELDNNERAKLFDALDKEPNGWKFCAIRFLENQQLTQTLVPRTADDDTVVFLSNSTKSGPSVSLPGTQVFVAASSANVVNTSSGEESAVPENNQINYTKSEEILKKQLNDQFNNALREEKPILVDSVIASSVRPGFSHSKSNSASTFQVFATLAGCLLVCGLFGIAVTHSYLKNDSTQTANLGGSTSNNGGNQQQSVPGPTNASPYSQAFYNPSSRVIPFNPNSYPEKPAGSLALHTTQKNPGDTAQNSATPGSTRQQLPGGLTQSHRLAIKTADDFVEDIDVPCVQADSIDVDSLKALTSNDLKKIEQLCERAGHVVDVHRHYFIFPGKNGELILVPTEDVTIRYSGICDFE
ncbi:MAG: hypothetical protein ACRC2T_04980 [Thermoguttaceae bacterium]